MALTGSSDPDFGLLGWRTVRVMSLVLRHSVCGKFLHQQQDINTTSSELLLSL